MRLGETGPRDRRRWGGFLMDTDMTGVEKGRRRIAEENEENSTWCDRLGQFMERKIRTPQPRRHRQGT